MWANWPKRPGMGRVRGSASSKKICQCFKRNINSLNISTKLYKWFNILIMICSTVQLSINKVQYVSELYDGCLCAPCLLELQKKYQDTLNNTTSIEC